MSHSGRLCSAAAYADAVRNNLRLHQLPLLAGKPGIFSLEECVILYSVPYDNFGHHSALRVSCQCFDAHCYSLHWFECIADDL